MNKFLHVKAKGFILFCLFFVIPLCLTAKEFVINEEVIEERAAQKSKRWDKSFFKKVVSKSI